MNKEMQLSRFGTGKKIASVFLSAAMLATSFVGLGSALSVSTVQADAAGSYGLADKIEDGNILHCFDWSISDITKELPAIAEAGFTSVQTSPIQPHDASGTWYWLYQPIGFSVGNDLGTKEDLKTLCSEADKYGIKVIVDVVANHVAGWADGRRKDYIQNGLTSDEYFHNTQYNTDANNVDWSNRWQITHCNIGMPDLNSEHSYVQQVVNGLVTELKSCGVDGIRWDAAKHIGIPSEDCGFWPAVTTQGLYNYGEILDSPGGDGAAVMKEYTKYIGVTDSSYSGEVTGAIRDGKVTTNNGNWANKGVSSSRIVYWPESHDTYCNNGWTNGLSEDIMDRAYAVLGSRANSQTLYLSRPFEKQHTKISYNVKGSTHFTEKQVAAVNHFKNAMAGTKEYYTTGSNCFVICREGGAVVVAASGSNFDVTVPNGGGTVKSGTYTDEITGSTWTVNGSTMSGKIGSSGIAVFYNGGVSGARVSASPEGGSFTTSVTATLSVSGATSGNYTTSDGQSGTYTNGKTITFGSSVAVGKTVTLTLSAKGEDGETKTATYTYTKKDPSAVTTIYFDNSSYKWSGVYAYVYASGTGGGDNTTDGAIHFKDTANWGTAYAYFFANNQTVGTAWPGTAMTKGSSDYYITVPSGATHVVFNNGNNGKQTDDLSVSGVYGYDASGNKYTSTDSGASTVTQNAAWPGVKMTLDASTGYYMYEVPDNLKNGRVIFTESETATTNRYPADGADGLAIEDTTKLFSANHSWKAYTPVKPDPEPDVPTVTASKATGSSFTTETMSLTLTLANAKSGTYSVDGGPTKTFTSSATFDIGEGKIGDSTVTVAATATGSDGTVKNYTFTYNKKYVVKTTSSSASALGGKYATNPSGQKGGKGVTIKSPSDFKESMIIAQGVANDDPRIFRGSHEAPVYDTYALYAAWDDTNLYLGWQFTNVTDVVDPAQGYPISDNGKPWNGDIPQMLAFDLGKGKSADMSKGNMAGGAYVWGLKVGFETKLDALMCFSSKPGVGQPALFKTDSTGYFNYGDDYVTGFKDGGISFKYEDGFFGSKITGIKSNGYSGYKPADLTSTSSAWVDFLSEGHDKSQDTFYYITIPFSALGITRSYLESTGIGVMHISTFGEGGIASCPMDMTMLDNATEAYSADESTSKEKEDTDTITVPLARIGAGDSPSPDPDPDPDPTPDPTTPLQVNFGTDKSAPQLTTTALTLKGIGIGGTAPYKYQFSVDGTVVKASNTTATYTWKPGTKGKHTIKCVITDSTGATATVSKTFTAEGDDVVDPSTPLTNNSTVSSTSVKVGDSVTLTGKASGGKAPYTYALLYKKSTSSTWSKIGEKYGSTTSGSFKPGKAVNYDVQINVKDSAGTIKAVKYTIKVSGSTTTALTNNSKVSATSVKLGDTVTLTAKAAGGTAPYTYALMYKKSSSSTWSKIGTKYGTASTGSFKPGKAVPYDIMINVKDSTGKIKSKTFTVNVTGSSTTTALTNKSSISAAKVSVGTKVTLKGAATGGTAPYKYAYYFKKSTASKYQTIGTEFGTATSATLTPTKAVAYDVIISVMDSKGTVESKSFAVVAS